MSDSNAELIRELMSKANGLCQIAGLFNEKLAPLMEEAEKGEGETEEETVTVPKQDFKSVLDLMESFPTVFQLLNTHIGNTEEKHKRDILGYEQREAEWEKLSEIFNAYKKKLSEDIAAADNVNKKMASEVELLNRENALLHQQSKLLQQKLQNQEDLMIRIQANHRRKKNLELIKQELKGDDEVIANAIASMFKLNQ